MTQDNPTGNAPQTEAEIAQALDVARDLVKAGVPVFLAPPCSPACRRPGHENGIGTGGSGFDLPSGWENAQPMVETVELWRPGWAMAAVCGHVVDVLDVDPRNGGDIAAEELKAGGVWPRTYGMASTPSGGTHELIRSIGVRKGTPYPGVDLQAGAPGGEGRGFVFIAPTVKVSKVDGVPRAYRWVTVPDMAALGEWGAGDDSGSVIATAIATVRARPQVPDSAVSPVDLSAADAIRLKAYADTVIARELANLRAARPGERNATAFRVACSLIEIANSPWSGVGREQVHAEFSRTAAGLDRPDDRFPSEEVYDVWTSAERKVGAMGRALPAERVPGERLTWEDVGGMPPFSSAGFTGPAAISPTYSPVLPGSTNTFSPNAIATTSAVTADPFGTVGYATPSATVGIPTQPGPAGASGEIYGSAPGIVGRKPLRLRTSADLDELPPVEWLVADLLMVDSTAWLIGKPGRGKTFVSLDLALCVATGKDFHGYAVRRGPVVYVLAESMRGARARVRAWEKVHYGDRRVEGVYFIDAADEGIFVGSAPWNELCWTVAQVRPLLIVIDTQARIALGVDENSAREMGMVVAEFDRLRRLGGGSCLLSVHHQGLTGQNARGSSAQLGAAQTEITVDKKERLVTVRVTKQKEDEPAPPLELHLDSIPIGIAQAPSVGDPWVTIGRNLTGGVLRPAGASERATAEEYMKLEQTERVVAVMRDIFAARGGTKAEIRSVMGEQYQVSKSNFYKIWNKLLSDGILAKVIVDDVPTSNYTLRSFGEGELSTGLSTGSAEASLNETVFSTA